ncbi:hypothetical protein TEA_000904 [Camellia sinensis var. sinensis]|uniref:B box-type domain-containing protein n=1 Tax=Camellia sinensis var. sinensis TaxID=542762 RepID=A0A4S4ERE3_CAMSN|nr:hypothetical protein TEA_000904 [Camellia sinensis var. sinensis]
MKGCELCRYPARIYCEADGASLCSHCDEKVHSANFLVAKHSRCLLCHVCQSPTPWKASGTKLGPTVSVCDTCVLLNCSGKQGRGPEGDEEAVHGGNENDETEDDFEGEDYSDDDEDGSYGDDEEDGDNQVVPWSSIPPPPPPPVASSSSSEEDEIGSTSSRFNHNIPLVVASCQALENDEATSSVSRRSLKVLRRTSEAFESQRVQESNETESRSSVAMILNSLRELQQNTISDDENPSTMVLQICRLSRDPICFSPIPSSNGDKRS